MSLSIPRKNRANAGEWYRTENAQTKAGAPFLAAIRFYIDVLQFDLVEDSPSVTNDGRPKRWVVVRPKGGQTGILLARADGEQQMGSVGRQFAGRVGMFLRVDDFETAYNRMIAAGVQFVSPPRDEPYGRLPCLWTSRGTAGTC